VPPQKNLGSRRKASTKLALENLEKNRWICFPAKQPAFSLEISRLLNFQGGKAYRLKKLLNVYEKGEKGATLSVSVWWFQPL
jgi:hypothetical protein